MAVVAAGLFFCAVWLSSTSVATPQPCRGPAHPAATIVGSSLATASTETVQSLPQCSENSRVAGISSGCRPKHERGLAESKQAPARSYFCLPRKAGVSSSRSTSLSKIVRSGSLERHESAIVGYRIDAVGQRECLQSDSVTANVTRPADCRPPTADQK